MTDTDTSTGALSGAVSIISDFRRILAKNGLS